MMSLAMFTLAHLFTLGWVQLYFNCFVNYNGPTAHSNFEGVITTPIFELTKSPRGGVNLFGVDSLTVELNPQTGVIVTLKKS